MEDIEASKNDFANQRRANDWNQANKIYEHSNWAICYGNWDNVRGKIPMCVWASYYEENSAKQSTRHSTARLSIRQKALKINRCADCVMCVRLYCVCGIFPRHWCSWFDFLSFTLLPFRDLAFFTYRWCSSCNEQFPLEINEFMCAAFERKIHFNGIA